MNLRKVALLIVLACASSACTKKTILREVFASRADWASPPGYEQPSHELNKVSEGVYSFRWWYYRNLILETNEGFVVVDPLNAEAAGLLKQELAKVAPGKTVHTILYSHSHLDHASGGSVLEAKNIIAHKACAARWADLQPKDVATPTQYLEGDQTITVGGMDIQLIDLGKSHSDGMFAFHVPSKRLLHTVDFGFVKVIPPGGIPDAYLPGYEKGLARLTKLDFDTWVPGHFGIGTKQDLLDWDQMMKDVKTLVMKSAEQYTLNPNEKDELRSMFDEVYTPLEEKYGSWHGFQEAMTLLIVRVQFGENIGY
jgi:glyoxylase-like metal-dependent hydrolase (beta-lactamase superfamily II)